jgi:hypothetical protein
VHSCARRDSWFFLVWLATNHTKNNRGFQTKKNRESRQTHERTRRKSIIEVKRFLKRFLLVLLVLLVLAQIPFIYRRYETGQLAQKIAAAGSQRVVNEDPNFKEYKGIIHAHTNLGGHSTGSFDEITSAANANGLDFVLMTEHFSEKLDTAAETLNGLYGKTLFIGGNEIETTDGDRFLLIPGGGETTKARMQGTTAFLEAAKRENKLAFVTYPERFKSWDAAFDGVEVFSLHTAAKQMSILPAIGDLIWTYPAYPELMLAKGWTRPDDNLAKFDEISARRPISLFAGTDAHSNIGFHFFGDETGKRLINIKLDPYETIFRMARMHVLIEKDKDLDRETLVEAIRAGRFFVGFDVLGDTTGFRFSMTGASATAASGDTINLEAGLSLRAGIDDATVISRIVVYRNGVAVDDSLEQYTSRLESVVTEPGVYRVEVYGNDLGPPFDRMPWIISNPIYVRRADDTSQNRER